MHLCSEYSYFEYLRYVLIDYQTEYKWEKVNRMFLFYQDFFSSLITAFKLYTLNPYKAALVLNKSPDNQFRSQWHIIIDWTADIAKHLQIFSVYPGYTSINNEWLKIKNKHLKVDNWWPHVGTNYWIAINLNWLCPINILCETCKQVQVKNWSWRKMWE